MMQAQDFPFISHSPKRWAEFVRTRSPILESIIPINSRGERGWKALDNDNLMTHARWRLADRGICGRCELEKADSGLYQALRKRKLLDEVGLPSSNEGKRSWAGMGREELVAYSKKFIAEKKIGKRAELKKVDEGLYQALRKRKLLDAVALEEKRKTNEWSCLDDGELVAFARDFNAVNGITTRAELKKADTGLLNVLWRRELLGEAGLPDSRGRRDWEGMGKGELVAHAKKFIAKGGIGGRTELKEADSTLYVVLRKRKLLGEVGLSDLRGKIRNWAGMDKEELVSYAKKFISERGINGRKKLAKADSGLYEALRKRKLLDAVFSDVESSKHADAVAGVIDALESFGDGK